MMKHVAAAKVQVIVIAIVIVVVLDTVFGHSGCVFLTAWYRKQAMHCQ